MLDVETMIRDELERLAPPDAAVTDWHDVRRRAQRPRRRLTVLAVAAALVVAVVAAPTFALSPGVRGFFGLGHRPFLLRAVPVVATRAGHGLVVRLWASPLPFVPCRFVVVSHAGAGRHEGAALCRGRRGRLPRLRQPIIYDLRLVRHANAARLQVPATLDGFVGPRLHAVRVELRWTGGSQRLAFRRGWFLGLPRGLPNPPRRNLPYAIVARKRIPSSLLYAR
jgi:hypothetical protein